MLRRGRNALKGAAEASRIPVCPTNCTTNVKLSLPSDLGVILHTPLRRPGWQVNFRGQWSFFTWNSHGSLLKTNMLRVAWSLHFVGKWGRRAEDPFRGLRAGPVRYSPLTLSPKGNPRSSPGLPTPQTPRILYWAKVCLNASSGSKMYIVIRRSKRPEARQALCRGAAYRNRRA